MYANGYKYTQADLTWFAKDKETLDAVYRARVLKHDVAAADLDEELR